MFDLIPSPRQWRRANPHQGSRSMIRRREIQQHLVRMRYLELETQEIRVRINRQDELERTRMENRRIEQEMRIELENANKRQADAKLAAAQARNRRTPLQRLRDWWCV